MRYIFLRGAQNWKKMDEFENLKLYGTMKRALYNLEKNISSAEERFEAQNIDQMNRDITQAEREHCLSNSLDLLREQNAAYFWPTRLDILLLKTQKTELCAKIHEHCSKYAKLYRKTKYGWLKN